MEQAGANVFLVVEADPTVARDLEESLLAFDARAVVHLALAATDARHVLTGLDTLTAAFLRLPAEEFRSAEIPGAVEARGGRIVVLDARPCDRPPDDGREWLYTGRPFGADAVSRALDRMGVEVL